MDLHERAGQYAGHTCEVCDTELNADDRAMVEVDASVEDGEQVPSIRVRHSFCYLMLEREALDVLLSVINLARHRGYDMFANELQQRLKDRDARMRGVTA
jgi:hypothetical protein